MRFYLLNVCQRIPFTQIHCIFALFIDSANVFFSRNEFRQSSTQSKPQILFISIIIEMRYGELVRKTDCLEQKKHVGQHGRCCCFLFFYSYPENMKTINQSSSSWHKDLQNDYSVMSVSLSFSIILSYMHMKSLVLFQ